MFGPTHSTESGETSYTYTLPICFVCFETNGEVCLGWARLWGRCESSDDSWVEGAGDADGGGGVSIARRDRFCSWIGSAVTLRSINLHINNYHVAYPLGDDSQVMGDKTSKTPSSSSSSSTTTTATATIALAWHLSTQHQKQRRQQHQQGLLPPTTATDSPKQRPAVSARSSGRQDTLTPL